MGAQKIPKVKPLQVEVYSQPPITPSQLKKVLNISKKDLVWWAQEVWASLQRRKLFSQEKFQHVESLQVIFVGIDQICELNKTYRKKNKPTDILSFEPSEPNSLGELVICLPVIEAQAKEHHMKVWEELGYMLTHGVLHLLGYDHEHGGVAAKKMYKAQEETFEDLCRRFEAAKTKS